MARTRGFKNAKKGFVNRTRGLMKKANTLHRLTGAHVAVLIEHNGTIYLYQSDDQFAQIFQNIPSKHKFGPDHFDTVADRSGRSQSPTLPSSQLLSTEGIITPPLSSASSTSTIWPSFSEIQPVTDDRETTSWQVDGSINMRDVYPLAVDFFKI